MRYKIFRAIRADNGKWCFGNLLKMNDRFYMLTEENCVCHRIKEETVCQHTGVWAEDNEKIFHLDVICYTDKRTKRKEKGLVIEKPNGYFVKTRAYGYFFEMPLFACTEIFVLGNVIENEDLKKEFDYENS